jgi:hypothetical protein
VRDLARRLVGGDCGREPLGAIRAHDARHRERRGALDSPVKREEGREGEREGGRGEGRAGGGRGAGGLPFARFYVGLCVFTNV